MIETVTSGSTTLKWALVWVKFLRHGKSQHHTTIHPPVLGTKDLHWASLKHITVSLPLIHFSKEIVAHLHLLQTSLWTETCLIHFVLLWRAVHFTKHYSRWCSTSIELRILLRQIIGYKINKQLSKCVFFERRQGVKVRGASSCFLCARVVWLHLLSL